MGSRHPGNTNFRLLVFLTAAATLMFELVAARLADFHLGAGNAYLAIPVTFLGLALGSMHVHMRPRIVERFRPVVALAVLAGLCYAAVLVVFVVFSRLLPVVSIFDVTDNHLYLLYKTLTFVGVLLPPFYYFGRILTVAYQIKRRDIGAIYSADFWGAALGSALTPLLFHFGGLPNVSLFLLGLTFLPVVVFFRGRMAVRFLIGAALLAACVFGARVIAIVDDSLDYTRYNKTHKTTEVTHAWNEHSRVALLARGKVFRIVHDNSRSNVHVRSYQPGWVGRKPRKLDALEVPVLLQRPTKEVLVLYAGCGAEMIELNELLGGKAHITGVELNPLVRDLAISTKSLERYRLKEFYDLPHIDLVIDEGRHFLSTTSRKYDLVFVGSNAATGVWMTGHSRKYLDTTQAFNLILDRLSDDGIIVFDYQPLGRRIETMKSVFRERGIPDFSDRVIVFDSREWSDDMIVSPSGFKRSEIRWLFAAAENPEQMRYVPGHARNDRHYVNLIEGPPSPEETMTDDRPFLLGLDWKGYRLIPDERYVKNYLLYLSWIKITTLLALVFISVTFIAAAGLRRSSSLPPSVLIYLLMTGFCFMLVEIALIAKLELFLQKPIVSMATVLSTFLLASGVGSRLFPRIEKRLRIGWFAVIVAGLVVASIFVLDFLGSNLLGLPVGARVLVAAVVMAPLGIALGLFYPYAVSCLVQRGRPQAVALSYGISTLSSVIGATYAMTVMLDLGFSSLLWQAAVGYVGLALFVLLYSAVLKGRYLSLTQT